MLSFKKTYTLQFNYKIPNYIDLYLHKEKRYRRFIKFYKRYLYIIFKGQKNLEVFSILPKHSKILWINISAPSLGDSLMDLSSRIMLKDKNMDLFTDIKNAHIYEDDEIFNNIFIDEEKAKINKYDLIILDSYSSRSVKIKSRIAAKTFYVGMFGFFNGPEVNRILFSFHQMNNLLGYVKSEEKINSIAKNTITISKKDKKIIKAIVPKKYIALVVGGEWKYKTYQNWGDLIKKLIADNEKINIVLIGSKNGQNKSKELLKQFNDYQFFDLVSKLSFNQSAEVIRRSDVLICCDGGLMHAANAVSAKVIALLARLTPEMLLTNKDSISLFDNEDVNNIKVEDVLLRYTKATNCDHNRLLS